MGKNKKPAVNTRINIHSRDEIERKNNLAKTNGNNITIKKYLNTNTVIVTVFVLLCYWLLAWKNGYMLKWYDEMSFFDSTRFFFRQALFYPGGLLRYAGTWLTQLMYYPILGSTVEILLWLFMAWLTKKAFYISDNSTPLCLIVPLCMLVSVVQLDEAWLSMNSAGYLYSNTIGFIFAISSLYLYHITRKSPFISMIILMLTAACYPFVGFFALLGASIGVILTIADSLLLKKYTSLVFSGLVITLIIVIPSLYYSYFDGTSVDNDYLYLKGLPDLLLEDFDIYLWRPFIIASLCLVVLAILSRIPMAGANRIVKYGGIAAVFVCIIWSIKAERKNEQLRATVRLLQYMENNDWYNMNDVMSHITESPSMTVLILNNVAVINQGGRGVNLDAIQPADKDPRHAESFTMTALVNVPVNYYEGLFNESYRWAMEHSVQYGKRAFYLKYMVKDALLNGEIELARRYNNLMMGTMFHRKWAEDMLRYINDPSLIMSNPEFRSILELSRRHNESK